MNLLDNIKKMFGSKSKPMNSYTYSSPFSFGMASSGMTVDANTAITTSAVYACVRVLAESIASLPLHVYKSEGEGKRLATDHPLDVVIHSLPNTEMTSYIWRETSMTHLLLWGNAYSQIIRDGAGRVIALYPLQPSRMAIKRDDKKKLYYEYSIFQDDTPGIKKTGTVILPAEQVLHIPGLGYDGIYGYSPIAMAKAAVGMSLATENFGSSFFKNGARLSGVLKTPGTIADPEKMRTEWNKVYSGSSNNGGTAILEEGLEYEPISCPPEDAQFLDTRKFQVEEIARIFRVPLHMINDLEHATFSNVEHLSLDFVKFTLSPWVARLEQGYDKALLSEEDRQAGYFTRLNMEGLLRGDYQSRMQGYATARQNGWMSANDIRALEDMNPIPAEEGGDLYLVNGSYAKLKDAGIAYANKNRANVGTGDEDES